MRDSFLPMNKPELITLLCKTIVSVRWQAAANKGTGHVCPNYPQSYARTYSHHAGVDAAGAGARSGCCPDVTTPRKPGGRGALHQGRALVYGKAGFPDLKRSDIGRLRPFGAILDFKLDFLAFVQAAVTATLNSREMRENVGTASVRRDEAETFIGVEPLDLALLNHLYSVLMKKRMQVNQGRRSERGLCNT